jgi:hypothetical protein
VTTLVRSNRRGLSRLEEEVTTELALAEAQATIGAGRAAARIRAMGRTARITLDETAAVNMAEAVYSRFAATDQAAARIELVATGAAIKLRSMLDETRI